MDLNSPNIRKMLSKNEGGFEQEYILRNLKVITKVRWNKRRFVFKCSIVIFDKQENGSWRQILRFDDSHGFRHMDHEKLRLKMPSGKFTLKKAECPILCKLIDSLPKEQADEWKTKLFNEFETGMQKWKEFLDNIHAKFEKI